MQVTNALRVMNEVGYHCIYLWNCEKNRELKQKEQLSLTMVVPIAAICRMCEREANVCIWVLGVLHEGVFTFLSYFSRAYCCLILICLESK
jgi:hypothetical protein